MSTRGEADHDPSPPDRGLTVGLFGTFYPEFQKAGNSTTGFARLWAQDPRVEQVVVIGPQGSRLPPGLDPQRVEVRPSWRLDGALSLLRALARLLRQGRGWDVLVFNIHLTSFGTRPWVNAIGLSLPRWWATLTGRRPVVFLHHLLESQDLGALGYTPTRGTRWIVRRLERGLARTCDVVVPLPSLAAAARRWLGRDVRVVFPRFVEAAGSGVISPDPAADPPAAPMTDQLRVLLFGYWGPQKELEGVLNDLASVEVPGAEVTVTVAGEVNQNFPEFAGRIRATAAAHSGPRFRFLGPIPESRVAGLFASHDVLLLPYRATGGYSGAMNLAAATGIGLVAYDLPQLRESASALQVAVQFVAPRDVRALAEALGSAAATRQRPTDAWVRALESAHAVLGVPTR